MRTYRLLCLGCKQERRHDAVVALLKPCHAALVPPASTSSVTDVGLKHCRTQLNLLSGELTSQMITWAINCVPQLGAAMLTLGAGLHSQERRTSTR